MAVNACAGPFGAAYDFYIERPRLMQVVGRAVWGIDPAPLYRLIDELRSLPEGTAVIDVPCGGGVALRGIDPARGARYTGGDIEPRMLHRAARRARARGLADAEFVHADMTALPFAEDSADLFLCLSGLHMIDEPALALGEIARCLRPGGHLLATAFLREGSRRQRAIFAAGARRGHAQPPHRDELLAALGDAGFAEVELSPRAGFAGIRARLRRKGG